MTEQKPRGTIKAGRLVSFESGEYSDYHIMGFFVTLQDLDVEQAITEWTKEIEIPPEDHPYRGIEGIGFLAFLLREGYLVEIDYDVLWDRLSGRPQDIEYYKAPSPC